MDIEVFNQGQASTTFVFLSLVLGLIFFENKFRMMNSSWIVEEQQKFLNKSGLTFPQISECTQNFKVFKNTLGLQKILRVPKKRNSKEFLEP